MSTIGQVSLPGDIHSRTPKWGNVWKSTLQSLVITESTLEELGSQKQPPPFRNAWGKGQTWWERWRWPGGDVCDLVRTKNCSRRAVDREDAPDACSPGRWIPGHSRCTGNNHTNYWAPRRNQWGLRGGKSLCAVNAAVKLQMSAEPGSPCVAPALKGWLRLCPRMFFKQARKKSHVIAKQITPE